jgi:hypothetical protein
MSAVQIRHEEEQHQAGISRMYLALVLASALILTTAVVILVPAPARAASGCQSTSAAVVMTNNKAEQRANTLLKSTTYTPVIRTFTPKPSSTKGFTGYETISVKSPKGTAPVVGYFKLTGNASCSVVVTSARVALSRNSYLVALKFPSEQGKTGSLKVTLISR